MRNLSFSALAPTAMAVIAACILATGGALLFSSTTHAQDGANAPRPALTVQTAPPRRTALAADQPLALLAHERAGAWVALYRAAGGGWQAPVAITTAQH